MRIDKWLWFVRFFRTRNLATDAVRGGHVRINGDRVKPGNRVSPGDRVDIVRGQLPYRVTVTSLPLRRGSATEAATAYIESAESRQARQALADGIRSDRLQMPTTRGRPDKRTRRALRGRMRRDE
jgi:ribosome-associated heat shock protein Hsp15